MSPRLTPDADAEELRTVVREFLIEHVEPTRDPEHGWDPATWRRLAGELGLVGLDVPEEQGGAGAGFREVAVVAEELGRSLARLPWFTTAVLGVGVLLHAPGTDLLPSLLDGTTTATLAYREHSQTRAVADARGDWFVSGEKILVLEGATADLVFVTAETADGPSMFAVEAALPEVSRRPSRAIDPNRQPATVTFDSAPAVLLGPAAPILEQVLLRASAALACEQTGGAAAAMEAAVGYAATRLQFGRPIATFQAIKHRCADMAVQVEAARSASLWAAAELAEGTPEAARAAATAALVCGQAYRWVADENVQVHGGIGFTWEHSAHLHVRRALSSAVLFEGSHGDALLDAIGV
jgi:alkylation response protein AidB-like acyl-CoA dehydrogenase